MEITEVTLNTTVEQALLNSRYELLPEEMAEDELTRWVADFDQLERKRRDGTGSDQRNGDEADPAVYAISTLIRNEVTPKISFYFATLFHIGRQWRVAEYAAAAAKDAMGEDNVRRSAERNLGALAEEFERVGVSPADRHELLSDSISDILSMSEQLHRDAIESSKRNWKIWKREVQELRAIIGDIGVAYGEFRSRAPRRLAGSILQLVLFSERRRELRRSFARQGIEFKDGANTQENSLVQLVVTGLLFGQEGGYWIREILSEYGRVLHEQFYLLEMRSLTPLRRDAEKRLLRKFKDDNPFEEFAPLKRPPDRRLRDLWDECRLPGDKMFYYAEKWLRSLEPTVSAYDELPGIKSITDARVARFSRSADSHIKREWVGTTNRVGETDDSWLQRLFERWITLLAASALRRVREGKGGQLWTIDVFEELIGKVASYLNDTGYNLVSPSADRLRTLWGKASTKDSFPHYYQDTW